MNWAFWFMVFQVISCAAAGFAFAIGQKNFWLGWAWLSYGSANIGFAMLAWKG